MMTSAAAWSAAAEKLLAGHESGADLSAIRDDVIAGRATLIEVTQSGGLVGVAVLRIDGHEGVIVSAAGRAAVDLTAIVLPELEARFIGVDSMRIHTARPGMVKKLQRQGYQFAEVVLRKKR